jgi:hypothetical protein
MIHKQCVLALVLDVEDMTSATRLLQKSPVRWQWAYYDVGNIFKHLFERRNAGVRNALRRDVQDACI